MCPGSSSRGDRGELQQLQHGRVGVLWYLSLYLSNTECCEEVGTKGVGVESETVIDGGSAEPHVVADKGLLPHVWQQEQLQEPHKRTSLWWTSSLAYSGRG